MKITRAIQYILFIVAFTCLLMCPAVHSFGDNVRHDVVLKGAAKTIQKHIPKGGPATTAPLSCTLHTAFCLPSVTAQKLFIFPSSHADLNLSILSSVRLIL